MCFLLVQQYQSLIRSTLIEGNYKPNRTGMDTISQFSANYTIDLQEGYPLLTTKKMDGFRWDSMIHELKWYLSGQEHIRDLREKTSIWDIWSDNQGRLDTAYGRFWRRYPIPQDNNRLDGEAWPDEPHRWVSKEDDGRQTFDQLQYIIDTLDESPHSRRMVLNAWHPANAAVSTLPPCHFTSVFNVQGDTLNLHLTQRSGDIALGIPFNIAAYSLLLTIIAQRTGFKPGTFSHTIVDAHIYCGSGDRGAWYEDNITELRRKVGGVFNRSEYTEVAEWITNNAPPQNRDNEDHLPNLLEQMSREPKSRPTIHVADKPLDDYTFSDIYIEDYDGHPGLDFAVAE